MCASNLTPDTSQRQPVIYQGDDFDHPMTPEEWAMIESDFDSRRMLILARFWSNVDRSGGPLACWPWVGSLNPTTGRGQFTWRDKLINAARVAYEMAYGPIPDSLFALHKCPGKHNPRCVNPRHIYAGTRSQNALDAIANGTKLRGEQDPRSKLTDDQVREIRRRHVPGVHKADGTGNGTSALAREFGISNSRLVQIIRRETRGHVV